jgi:hypothetical protein
MLESLRAVQTFLNAHADKLDGVVKTGARQRLSDAIAALSGHATGQTGSHLAAQGATQKKRQLRGALIRDHMAPIARVARADLPSTVELRPFKMPRGRPTAEKLVALATGMGAAAQPFSDVFTSAGLPVDFITQLSEAADALVGTIASRANSRGSRTQATQGLKTSLSEGRRIVHILDAFVQTALVNDPALLANWNLVKRVPKTPPGRPAAADAPQPDGQPASQPPSASPPEPPAHVAALEEAHATTAVTG